jgi:dolichyl-diphosphooligosaccharide---protein glycosyltransferase
LLPRSLPFAQGTSRSISGSYEIEGIAIFVLLLTFYLFVHAVNMGSLAWVLASVFVYF